MGRFNPYLILIVLFGLAVVCVTWFLVSGVGDSSRGGKNAGERRAPYPPASRDHESGKGDSTSTAEELRKSREKIPSADKAVDAWFLHLDDALHGRVIEDSGAPVEGASVRAVRVRSPFETLAPAEYVTHETKSGPDGEFRMEDLLEGDYYLCALSGDRVGFVPAAIRRGASPHAHEIVLGITGSISGKIVGPDGAPVHDALVIPYEHDHFAVRTDEGGRFSITHLPWEEHFLQILASGFAQKLVMDVDPGDHDLIITLAHESTLSGRILHNNKPVPGGTIVAYMKDDGTVLPVKTRSRRDGTYRLQGLSEGTYQLELESNELASPADLCATLKEGEHLDGIDIELERRGILSGRVIDADTKEPLMGVRLMAVPPQDSSYNDERGYLITHTDVEGNFLFPSLPPTKYKVRILKAGAYIREVWGKGEEISLAPGERRKGIDFALKKGAVIQLAVRGESGTLVSDATVWMDDADDSRLEDRNGYRTAEPSGKDDGRYFLKGLRPGVVNVTVKRRGWTGAFEHLTIKPGDDVIEKEIVLSPSFSLRGFIKDEIGKGIPGAVVELINYGQVTRTDTSGSFCLFDTRPGRNWICIQADGFLDWSRSLDVEESEEALEFTLVRRGGCSIEGKVLNDLGEPVSGVKMTAHQFTGTGHLEIEFLSGDDGSFRIDGLNNGAVDMEVEANKGRPREEYFELMVGTRGVRIVVDRFARIEGRLLDAEGKPITSFTAEAASEDVYFFSGEKSFRDGEFVFEEIVPGRVRINFDPEDGPYTIFGPITIAPGEIVKDLEVRLSATGGISGVVLDKQTGLPVPGARVYVADRIRHSTSDVWNYAQAETKEDGSFLLEGIIPGSNEVMVIKPDYAAVKLKGIEIHGNGITECIRVLLPREARIQGHVFMDGRPKEGIRVYAKGPDSRKSETMTDVDGFFCLKRLPPGDYVISTTNHGYYMDRISVQARLTVGEGETVERDLVFDTASLEGIVYIFDTPRKGARIHIESKEQDVEGRAAPRSISGRFESKKDGSYRFIGLTPGRYEITVYYNGSEGIFEIHREAEIHEGRNTRDLRIESSGFGNIEGYLFVEGVPQKDSQVSVLQPDLSFGKHVSSDQEGRFEFRNIPAGRVRLRSYFQFDESPPSFLLSKELELLPGETIRQDFHLAPGTGVLLVTVKDKAGSKVYSTVEIIRKTPGEEALLSINLMFKGDSRRVEHLPPGEYELKIKGEGYEPKTATVANGKETRVDFSR